MPATPKKNLQRALAPEDKSPAEVLVVVGHRGTIEIRRGFTRIELHTYKEMEFVAEVIKEQRARQSAGRLA